MKHSLPAILFTALFVLHGRGAVEPGRRLAVEIAPRFAGAPLAFDVVTHVTALGQQISVTRLDFLLSNIAVRRADGGWLGLTNWFAYLSLREGRTGFELNNLPAGGYDRLRFQVGVPQALNHADPAQFGPSHPLNPNVNGLHWNWQGGYVFFALEGLWRNTLPDSTTNSPFDIRPSSLANGYSYHVASDRLLMTVELPVTLELSADRELRLALNVDRIFAATHTIRIGDETSSTHSREDDPLAGKLRDNIQRAFDVISLPMNLVAADVSRRTSLSVMDTESAPTNVGGYGSVGQGACPVVIAPDATPYRLTISRFFPRPALPLDNPLTVEGVELGRLLFHDPRLSRNNSQSCASCHQAEAAFTDAGKRFSLGAEGQAGHRNAMPLFNLAWKSSFFWDGRAPTLREQVLQPIQNPIEMHETLTNVMAKLQSSRSGGRQSANSDSGSDQRRLTSAATDEIDYPAHFARAFGTPDITADRLARALEQFLLTQVSHDSKFDRTLNGQAKLTAEEQRGFELFHTEYDPRRRQFGADCFHCHGGPLFRSQSFANNGLDAEPRDLGRFLVTGLPGDKGKFAVPSLRNVAATAPYMHDGRFATLEEVIEHYATGVKRSATLDPNLAKHPAGGVPLSANDQRALVAFLRTLTDEQFVAPRRDVTQDAAIADVTSRPSRK
jgi:cytochrome c peroxidase